MGAVIGQILPLAVGVALSPLPIMGVIVMLIVGQRTENAIAFILGWVLGAFVECIVAASLAIGATAATSSSGTPRLNAIIQLVIGVVTLALAVKQWHTLPAPGEPPKPPRWMKALDRLNAATAVGFGAIYVGANIKNVPLIVSAGTSIGVASLGTGEQLVAAAIFALLCTLGPGLPVLVYLLGGAHATKTLDTWKTWLELHNGAVMSALLLFFGVKFLGDGLAGLF